MKIKIIEIKSEGTVIKEICVLFLWDRPVKSPAVRGRQFVNRWTSNLDDVSFGDCDTSLDKNVSSWDCGLLVCNIAGTNKWTPKKQTSLYPIDTAGFTTFMSHDSFDTFTLQSWNYLYTDFSAHRNHSFSTGWRTKCHTIDCARNKFLLLQKHLTSGTELILIGCKVFLTKSMFNMTTVLPHNLLQTNPCVRHNFSTQVFRKRAAQLHYVGPQDPHSEVVPQSGTTQKYKSIWTS